MRRKKTGLGSILITILVFIIFFFIGSWSGASLISGSLEGISLVKPSDKTVMLVGVDARNPNEPSRSDTIILVFFHPKANRIDLLSIPRDTRVSIEGENFKRKINHAHMKGGVELLEKTVQDNLGVTIDAYVKVNFSQFKQAIDTLGGVEINVEKKMYYPYEDIDLKPGLQRLNGHDALAYVRYRSDGLGDIGRVERQQKFLRALGRQAFGYQGIIKSPSIINETRKNVKTNLSTRDMAAIARQFVGEPTINSYTLPGESKTINGGSYWVVDWTETRNLLKEITESKKSQGNDS